MGDKILISILKNYKEITGMMILTESCVAFSGRREDDVHHTAFIYDYNKKRIVAEYEADPDCKLIFQRTHTEDIFSYYNKDLAKSEKALDASIEYKEFKVDLNKQMDADAIKNHKNNMLIQLDENIKNGLEIKLFLEKELELLSDSLGFKLDRIESSLKNKKTYLINNKNFSIQDTIPGIAYDITSSKNGLIYIREGYPRRVFSTKSGLQDDLHYCRGILKDSKTNSLFFIIAEGYEQIISHRESPYTHLIPHTTIECCDVKPHISPKRYKEYDAYHNIRAYAYMKEDKLIFSGCHRDAESCSLIAIWDFSHKDIFSNAIQVKDDIQQLLYLPEKNLIVGYTQNNSFFYLFNEKLEYKIIHTAYPIQDIAVFGNENNKILYNDGQLHDLECYINPQLIEHLNNTLASVGMPKVVTDIIINYAISKNPYSIFPSQNINLEHKNNGVLEKLKNMISSFRIS